jgi:hypothetical protein
LKRQYLVLLISLVLIIMNAYVIIFVAIYRVSQDECARLRGDVPYVKVHRYNPKHLYPKLNGYGDNGHRKVCSSCGSMYCCCFAFFSYSTLRMNVLERCISYISTSTRLAIHVPCKVLETIMTTTALVRVFRYFNLMASCNSC